VLPCASLCSPFSPVLPPCCGAGSFLYAPRRTPSWVPRRLRVGSKYASRSSRVGAALTTRGCTDRTGWDQTLDAFLWAAEKLGYKDVDIQGTPRDTTTLLYLQYYYSAGTKHSTDTVCTDAFLWAAEKMGYPGKLYLYTTVSVQYCLKVLLCLVRAVCSG